MSRLKIVQNSRDEEISDEALADLALELEGEEENTLLRLADAVLAEEWQTAKIIAREVKRSCDAA